MYRRLKYLELVLLMLLGLYPIAELTRVIAVSGVYYFPNMKGQMVAEIIIMWCLYLSIIPVFLLFSNGNIRHIRKARSEKLQSTIAGNSVKDLSAEIQPEYIKVNFLQEKL